MYRVFRNHRETCLTNSLKIVREMAAISKHHGEHFRAVSPDGITVNVDDVDPAPGYQGHDTTKLHPLRTSKWA